MAFAMMPTDAWHKAGSFPLYIIHKRIVKTDETWFLLTHGIPRSVLKNNYIAVTMAEASIPVRLTLQAGHTSYYFHPISNPSTQLHLILRPKFITIRIINRMHAGSS